MFLFNKFWTRYSSNIDIILNLYTILFYTSSLSLIYSKNSFTIVSKVNLCLSFKTNNYSYFCLSRIYNMQFSP